MFVLHVADVLLQDPLCMMFHESFVRHLADYSSDVRRHLCDVFQNLCDIKLTLFVLVLNISDVLFLGPAVADSCQTLSSHTVRKGKSPFSTVVRKFLHVVLSWKIIVRNLSTDRTHAGLRRIRTDFPGLQDWLVRFRNLKLMK